MADIIGNQTLRDLWENTACCHDTKTFLIFQNRDGAVCEYSYQQFNDEINKTANLFLHCGIRKGDRVAVQLCSSPEFMMCLFGLAKIGAVTVPLNDQGCLSESQYALEKCQVQMAVVEERFVADYRALQREYDLLPLGLMVARSTRCLEDALNFNLLKDEQPTLLKQICALESEDAAEILFTSGTTSYPKGVVLTHCNLLYAGVYGVWQVSLRNDDRLLSTMPACHSNFQLAALMPVIVAAATLIVVERYSARNFWRQLCSYEATVTQCVSMMVRTLLLQPVQPDERRHHIREILYFLPLSDAEKQAFEQRFAVRLMNSYGSTESVTWVITDPPTGERRWPSVGRAGLGYEIKIVDDAGLELPPHAIGEIWIKGVPGRTLMQGYYKDQEETARTLNTDGWMRTGDKGYVDEDGWFFFVDRNVNLIKRAGENISTTEIETLLATHPAIAEAAVIGVPDLIRDEAVKVFIVPAEGASITQDEVLEYCREHLAAYKVPSYVEIRAELPHTSSMKIEKKVLRKEQAPQTI
ncbi:MAG: crotonobetaine/carnitine-CoA ligase [Coriobacteriales bacterium]|jgi:crotonobetaine/carnitine-CoA ligase|nr:crotonobetaine/carnitine-CoA ligase [Coriobacteriales bacterium]